MDIVTDLILGGAPKLNPLIVNGWSVHEMENTKRYLDRIIECVAESFPEGLTFDGSDYCDPVETFQVVVRARGFNSRRGYDIAKNSVFMVRYNFTYRGTKLAPAYFYLPYVSDGGLMYISGILYSVSPVLADRVYSVSETEVFVKLNRAKLKFLRVPYHFVEDGQRVSGYMAHSSLHNAAGRKSRTRTVTSSTVKLNAIVTPLALYLFCKYGLYDAFARVGRCAIKVFTTDTINYAEWPEDKYVVTKSFGYSPTSSRYSAIRYQSIASKLVMVIEREDYTPLVKALVTGFWYVVDHYPEELCIENVGDIEQWHLVLGYSLFGDSNFRVKLIEDIELHIDSLDGYVDDVAREEFLSIGVKIDSIYDVFVEMLNNMDRLMIGIIGNQSSLYGKHLTVLPYILSSNTTALFNMLFKLKSNPKKELTVDGVNKLIQTFIKPLMFFHTLSMKHGELNSVSNPHDNLFFKITSKMVHQNDSTGGGSKEPNPADPANHLHVSFAEVSGMTVLNKSDPLSNDKLNPCLIVDPSSGDIIRNERFRELLDNAQQQITRKR